MTDYFEAKNYASIYIHNFFNFGKITKINDIDMQ